MHRFLFAVLALITPLAVHAQRLPGTVIPHHYELFLAPDLETFEFAGRVAIDVSVNEPVDAILIHALELEFDRVRVLSGGATINASVVPRTSDEMVELRLANRIDPGPATIEIDYRGVINDKLRGFYRGFFRDGTPYASTQLQSTSARQMFPSFDEPAMKATFDLSVEVDEGLMVVSNAPVESQSSPRAGRTLVDFRTTPRMSTYLVALTVGRFAALEDEYGDIPLRIIASPDRVETGRYALEATRFILEWMEEYYGIPFPFAKLDQIAIPDFQAGAMENAGAIIYRETALLVDEATASEASRRWVATVIAHEIAHQWFGDLVTMEWWDDVWLNEGFASFMEDKPLLDWKPEWDLGPRIVAGTGWALNTDTLPTTRAIRSHAETSAEIDSMFDGISYSKGSALLRMIESWTGADAFRDGVRMYLRRHAWRNTSSADLAEALADASDLPVESVLNDFVNKTGLPLVTVSTTCENGSTRVNLSQRRFVSDRAAMRATDETVWSIPVCFQTSSGRRCVLLDTETGTFTLPGCQPVFANDDGSGYYITRYDDETLATLAANEASLSPSERLVLLRDMWLQVRPDIEEVGDYLDLVAAFDEERHRAVISEILTRIGTIDSELVSDAQRDEWQEWLRSWARPMVDELGWQPAEGESSETRSMRASLLDLMSGPAADRETRTIARRMAESWLEDPTSIHPDLTATVLGAAARNGDQELFDAYTQALKKIDDPSHHYALLYARTQFPIPAAHEQILSEILAGEVRNQDIDRLLRSMISNFDARATTWKAIRDRWNDIVKLVPETDLPGIAAGAAEFCSQKGLDELEALVSNDAALSRSRSVRQARQRINSCMEFRQLHAPDLAAWLEESAR